MKNAIVSLFLLLATASAQTSTSNSGAAAPASLQATLQQLEQTAQAASLDIARLRIDKWKADSATKQQAQSNADSLSRNMVSALPSIVAGARTSPTNLSATFKLYRNLNALYDVLAGLTESTGAFGSKQEFDSLSQHAGAIDGYRRTLGDYVESLAASKDAELSKLRSSATATSAATPKKIIVDNEPAKKSSKKKK